MQLCWAQHCLPTFIGKHNLTYLRTRVLCVCPVQFVHEGRRPITIEGGQGERISIYFAGRFAGSCSSHAGTGTALINSCTYKSAIDRVIQVNWHVFPGSWWILRKTARNTNDNNNKLG